MKKTLFILVLFSGFLFGQDSVKAKIYDELITEKLRTIELFDKQVRFYEDEIKKLQGAVIYMRKEIEILEKRKTNDQADKK
jgi:hypothetical protein